MPDKDDDDDDSGGGGGGGQRTADGGRRTADGGRRGRRWVTINLLIGKLRGRVRRWMAFELRELS